MQRQKSNFDNINIDWNLTHDDGSTDFSEDETIVDDRVCLINNYIILKRNNYLLYLEWIINTRKKE